jgi:hypothetical protein
MSEFHSIEPTPVSTYSPRMIFSDLALPAEAGFAKAGNRFSLFGNVR